MFESGMRIVGMLADESANAVSRPENLHILKACRQCDADRTREKLRRRNVRRSSFSYDDSEFPFPRGVLQEGLDGLRMSDCENEFPGSNKTRGNCQRFVTRLNATR
jgi:hypothetical protein